MTGDSYRDRTDAQNYEVFLNALAGLEDDASIEGYSGEGQECLRAALSAFRAEFKSRHEPLEQPE